MSGVEIAGLVLGALPLFLAAADSYKKTLDFAHRALKKHEFVDQYQDELQLQRTLLNLYVKAVVGRSALDPALQAELVDKPTQATWQKNEVVKKLSKELGEAYQPFVGLLNRICTTLAKQIRSDEKSKVDKTDEELLSTLQNLCLESKKAPVDKQDDIWSRIKFSWKHPKRLAIIAELKSYNSSLEQLSNAVSRAKPYERKQETRRVHATFELRTETERLYQVISKACNCNPLKPRDVGFGLAVHHHQLRNEKGIQYELLFFDADDNVCITTVVVERASESDEPCKKSIKIMGLSTHHKDPKQLRKLKDICQECQLMQKNKGRLQLVVNKRGELYANDKPGQTSPRSQDAIVSLCDLMVDLKIFEQKTWLHREKAILAVVLAYSMLQLHESSWWQSIWDSKTISFLGLRCATTTAAHSPDLRMQLNRPFTRSMVAATGASPSPGPQPRRNAHLHALGIVLLELYLNRSLKAEFDHQGTTDYCGAAMRLLQEHADDINLTPEYYRAISFCLSPRPNARSRSYSFEDRGFREIFYEEVIAMLEDNLTSRFEVDDQIWTGEPA